MIIYHRIWILHPSGYGGRSPLLITSYMYYVYILKCSDHSCYTGCTHDLEDRVKRHNLGQIQYTKTRIPVKLHVYVAFSDKYKAYDFERYLKSGSGIAFRNKHLI